MKKLPAAIMVWTVNDRVIEDHDELHRQFHDIRQAGFEGVAVYVRCSRYGWDQRPAREALGVIGKLCRQHGMHFWLGPDPRFIARRLLGAAGGLPVVLFGDRVKASEVPHFAPVIDNRFSVRCEIPSRQTHMLREVAIEYFPIECLRVLALPAGQSQYAVQDIVDLTGSAHFFYNAHDRYVEAFGAYTPPDDREWQVLAFFLVRSSHFDFTDRRQMQRYHQRLARLAGTVESMDLFMWDEPGFTCMYGALPFSPAIEQQFRALTGLSLRRNLWKLAVECTDHSHIAVRIAYFRIVQEAMLQAQRQTHKHVAKLWSRKTKIGIHDTWHFESADMCDMNHGSMDLWHSLQERSGGFVDLGGVNELRRADSNHYANLAAMAIIGKSLGRFSTGGFAFNNLWTVDDDNGEGWQRSVMDHCVNVMALFGQRWLAHCYGPAGTIGEEERFLGSAPLPGYPQHSTWPGFPQWNQRLRRHCNATQGKLPWANLLLVYPIESLYALANNRADAIAQDIFALLLALCDHHYHVEVVSTGIFAAGRWRHSRFKLRGFTYDAVVLPHARILPKSVFKLLRAGTSQTLFAFATPERSLTREFRAQPVEHTATSIEQVLAWLQHSRALRPVKAPAHCWVTLTTLRHGTLVTLAPARHRSEFDGEVTLGGRAVSLNRRLGLTRLLFSHAGAKEIQ